MNPSVNGENIVLLIGSLDKISKSYPDIVNKMRHLTTLSYKNGVRYHTDSSAGGIPYRIFHSKFDMEFFYHDSVYTVKKMDYILFDANVLHGTKTKEVSGELFIDKRDLKLSLINYNEQVDDVYIDEL